MEMKGEYLKGDRWVRGSFLEKVKDKPEQEKYLIEMFRKGLYHYDGINDVIGDPSPLAKCHDVTLLDLIRLLHIANTETTRRWLTNIQKQIVYCRKTEKKMEYDKLLAELIV